MVAPFALTVSAAVAAPLPGGTLDPLTVPKYVTPLVIPPVMKNDGTTDSYDIAVRQFAQQILPGGLWNYTFQKRSANFILPATTPVELRSSGWTRLTCHCNRIPHFSQFNYPAYTFETMRTNRPFCGRPVDQRSR